MNIKDFLIDNYIWILTIILILIVTIIGFLADKKKGNTSPKKEKKVKKGKNQPIDNSSANNNLQPNNGQVAMQSQEPPQNQVNPMNNQVNNDMNLHNNAANSMNMVNTNMEAQPVNPMNNPIPMETPVGTQPQVVQTIPNMMAPASNNPQPVENIASDTQQESMYQPLSEQIPVISPQPVPNYNGMSNMSENVLNQASPMPVGGSNMDNQMNNGMFQGMPNNIVPPVMPLPSNDMSSQPVMPEMPTMAQPMPNYNMPSAMPQPMENGVLEVVPNLNNNNNTTIPSPVNTIPTPQPVAPQPIMPQPIMNNQAPMMQQPQMVSPLPNYNVLPQQGMPEQNNNNANQPMAPQAPVNFVFGPQDNNQNM